MFFFLLKKGGHRHSHGSGPPRWWLYVIGKAEEDKCDCGKIQNAVHLGGCPLVGDGRGMSVEEIWGGLDCYRVVADFLVQFPLYPYAGDMGSGTGAGVVQPKYRCGLSP